jgi:putative FmdB family regulatory protein
MHPVAASGEGSYNRGVPIYEFYCPECHRIFSFLSRRIDTDGRPPCPRCRQASLQRRPSAFAISRNRAEEKPAEGLPPGFDEAKLEQAMSALAAEGDALESDDPVASARMMRRLFETTGLPMNDGMREALRRMESGEDPEKVEAEMGDSLAEDPFATGAAEAGSGRVKARLRHLLPPSVDATLYEM